MSKKYSSEVEVARSYYNSEDADNFYYMVWGGEDLHLGIYEHENEDIFTASRRTIDRMASKARKIDRNTRIIDLGGGFAGSARHLAKKYGCQVVVLNLSEAENERGRKMNKEQGLDHLIEVVDGSFDEIPYEDNTFDIVWSEDAILHSDARDRVIRESTRVLKPGGEFIFTDPMQTDDCNEQVLTPIYERINLSSLGSPSFYREACKKYGLKEDSFEEMADQLALHYYRVLQDTEKSESKLDGHVSQEYIDNMKKGLRNWVKGGREGNLTWGIFHFIKQA